MVKHPASRGATAWERVAPLLILGAGFLAYSNGLTAPFIFDDHRQIVHNPRIHAFWTSWLGTTRPVVDVSLAFNCLFGDDTVLGYHLVNLAIHLLAALTLYGLVRRTLAWRASDPRSEIRGPRSAIAVVSDLSPPTSDLRPPTSDLRPPTSVLSPQASGSLALAAALLWVVHPLNTESVTYIIQRAESLMGLCYFFTLYSFIRGWPKRAILACAVGMATKPVMVTAPLLVLLYDRTFLAGSVREALRRRRGLYLGLAATWMLLGVLLATERHLPKPSAGFAMKDITPLGYFLTQPGVVLHYLKLSLWPHPLILDYLWPVARLKDVPVPTLAIGALVWATLWALRHRPPLGFLGAWVFGILAPSSSVMPIADLAVEHRMYLPLAGVVVLAVVGGHEWLRRGFGRRARLRGAVSLWIVAGLTGLLAGLTIRRNWDYRSEAAMWSDVLAKRPEQFRAVTSLGDTYRRQGRYQQALDYFSGALRLRPDHPQAHYNMGVVLLRLGRVDEAVAHYRRALELQRDSAEIHNHLGIALKQQGKLEEAIVEYRAALRLEPDYADVHYNLANVFSQQGKLDAAVVAYATYLRLQPDYAEYAEAHNSLGSLLAQQGKLEEAASHCAEAIRRKPDYAEAYSNLGTIDTLRGTFDEAAAHYREALRVKPDYAAAHTNFGNLLAQQGRVNEAAAHYREALRLQPDDAATARNLRVLLARFGMTGRRLIRASEE